MKISPKDTDSFLKRPPADVRATLIYGADGGLVRARRDILLDALGCDRADPFGYIEHDGAAMLDTPSRLFEDLSAMNLMGGVQAICVTNVSNKHTDMLKEALDDPACCNPLILLAGELQRGSLRTLFDSAKRRDCAAVACYRKEGRDLAVAIRQFFAERTIQAAPDVMQSLAAMLGNDSAVTMSELEKIDLYLGDERVLTHEIVHHLLQDNQHHMLSDAALQWMVGQQAACFTATDQLFRAGEHPVSFVRILAGLVFRLVEMRVKVDDGTPVASVVASVYFKDKPHYTGLLQRWSARGLLNLYHGLQTLELELKRTTVPQLVLSQKLLMLGRA